MTRNDLIDAYVQRGVAKWGEAERSGLLRQTRAKDTRTLEYDHALAHNLPIDTKPEDLSWDIAAHCLDEGQS